jgi:serine/threonine-protein kinase
VTESGELFAGRYRVGSERPDFAFLDSVEALDEKLHRRVVITTVKERFASNAAFVDQFAKHARAGLSLVHPAIARTYDVGTDHASGKLYMVTELVAGQSLHERLKEGALTTHAAAALLRQVALGLDYASGQGNHHLGLSPRKIWITAAGRAVVTGLSMSALASDTAPTADFLASASNTSGYLAPEQILAGATSEATDVYALGVTLSEALCARPTWDRNLRGEALLARASTKPVLPGSVVVTVPAEVDALIAQATQPDVTARTVSLAKIAETLESFVTPTVEVPHAPSIATSSSADLPTELLSAADLSAAGVQTALASSLTTRPGINPAVAQLFPASSLSDAPFTLAEFTAGRNPKRFVALLSIMVGIVVALAVAILAVVSALPANVIPSTSRPVPGVVGYSYDQASQAISDAGLVPVKIETASTSVEAGKVISVSPGVGTKLEIGAKVAVSVSLGAKNGTVPDVVGMSLAAAQKLITQAGFVIGTVSEVANGSSVKGTVISTKPAAGETAPALTTINFFEASGKVTIPVLVGKTVTEATNMLTSVEIGLSPTLKADTSCRATSPATVKSQSAGPGEVASGSKITLTYCTGS